LLEKNTDIVLTFCFNDNSRDSSDVEKHAKDVKDWSNTYSEIREVINFAAATGQSHLKHNLKEAFSSGKLK
jgi:hypothetical protein